MRLLCALLACLALASGSNEHVERVLQTWSSEREMKVMDLQQDIFEEYDLVEDHSRSKRAAGGIPFTSQCSTPGYTGAACNIPICYETNYQIPDIPATQQETYYTPMPVPIRYSCGYEYTVDRVVLPTKGDYFFQVEGITFNGFRYRIIVPFTVFAQPATSPTPSPAPTAPPTKCQNDGLLVNPIDGSNPYCFWQGLWQGNDCSQRICMNGGKIRADNTCDCGLAAFDGDHCQNGTFYNGLQYGYRLGCETPWISDYFSCPNGDNQNNDFVVAHMGEDEFGNAFQRISTGHCSPPVLTCGNGGYRYNGSCYCDEYWTGEWCTIPICVKNGTRDSTEYRCICQSGFTEPNCQYAQCEPMVRYHFGGQKTLVIVLEATKQNMDAMNQLATNFNSIIANATASQPNWFQNFGLVMFDIDPPPPYQGGDCRNYGVPGPDNSTCFCPPGWTGKKCEYLLCYNGGTPQSNNQKCNCPVGWDGQFCDIPVCLTRGPDPEFLINYVDMVFAVELTAQEWNQIHYLNLNFADLIRDVQHQNPNWIANFVLVGYNSTWGDVLAVAHSENPAPIIQEMNNLAQAPPTDTGCVVQLYKALDKALQKRTISAGSYVHIFQVIGRL